MATRDFPIGRPIRSGIATPPTRISTSSAIRLSVCTLLIIGLSGTSLTECARLKPNQGIHASGWNAIRFGLGVGLVSGLFFGLGAGLIAGLVFGGTAYLQHYVLRWFLARQHALPWRAVPFLEEMTHCVLLQRVGGGYRFVHPLLQDYFASLPLPPLS